MGYEPNRHFPVYHQTLMGDKVLSRCPPDSWGVLLALMCLSADGNPVGTLTDGNGKALDMRRTLLQCFSGAIIEDRCVAKDVDKAWKFLVDEGRVVKDDEGRWCIPKMLRIGDDSEFFRKCGQRGGNPSLIGQMMPAGGWTVDDCTKAAATVGMTPEMITACHAHYNSQGWQKGNGIPAAPTFSALRSLMTTWKIRENNGADRMVGARRESVFALEKRIDAASSARSSLPQRADDRTPEQNKRYAELTERITEWRKEIRGDK